jgi:hypothetical protein
MLPALTVQGSSAKLVKKWLRSVGNMPQPRVGRNGGFRCQLIGSSRWRRLTKVRLCVFILIAAKRRKMHKKAGRKRVSACGYTARPEFKIRSLRNDRFLVMQMASDLPVAPF